VLDGSVRIEKGQRLLQPQLNDYAERNGRANSFGRRANILEPVWPRCGGHAREIGAKGCLRR
jgi:hypothetical protein